jgi:hypothetical protein
VDAARLSLAGIRNPAQTRPTNRIASASFARPVLPSKRTRARPITSMPTYWVRYVRSSVGCRSGVPGGAMSPPGEPRSSTIGRSAVIKPAASVAAASALPTLSVRAWRSASSLRNFARSAPFSAADEDEINTPAQQHFAENQACFHRLTGADIVGNQQIDPRKAQGLPQGKKLVGVLVDAGPEWGLEQVPIGGGRGIPAKRAQIGREYARVVGSELRDAGPAFVLQNRAVELRIPKNLNHIALSVIVHAGQAKRRQSLTGGALVLHQPTSSADAHEISALWSCRHYHPEIPIAALSAMICSGPPDCGSVVLTRWRALPSTSPPADRRA